MVTAGFALTRQKESAVLSGHPVKRVAPRKTLRVKISEGQMQRAQVVVHRNMAPQQRQRHQARERDGTASGDIRQSPQIVSATSEQALLRRLSVWLFFATVDERCPSAPVELKRALIYCR